MNYKNKFIKSTLILIVGSFLLFVSLSQLGLPTELNVLIFSEKRLEYIIVFIILSNIFSKLSSIIVFIFLILNFKSNKKTIKL